MFKDFLNLQGELFSTIPTAPVESKVNRQKTWDEKYEDELEFRQHRIKEDSGLKDLAASKLSWGAPPTPNPQDGLTIEDREAII